MTEPITHDQVREVFARLLTRIDAANVKHYENHMGECQIHVWDNDGNPIGMICAGAEFLDDEGRMIARFAKSRYDNGGLRKFATVAEFEAAVYEALAYTMRGKKLTDPEIEDALQTGKAVATKWMQRHGAFLRANRVHRDYSGLTQYVLQLRVYVKDMKRNNTPLVYFPTLAEIQADDWEVVDD